ncbi:hypothetical protein FK513_30130, partial [Klebsiella pneumoniae]|nr:hypothetical protein [Klebsiella pneumoniae]
SVPDATLIGSGNGVQTFPDRTDRVYLNDEGIHFRLQRRFVLFQTDKARRKNDKTDNDAAWSQGILSFSDKPLSEVIATLSRYRNGAL